METEVIGTNAISGKNVDLTGNVTEVLKTLVLLDKNYGATYIARLLRGDLEKIVKNPAHTSLETYGKLPAVSVDGIRLLIYYMGEIKLVQPRGETCTTVEITPTGRRFLDNPWPITVPVWRVRFNKFDYELRFALKQFREAMANELKQMPYELFSDWTLDHIVKMKPQTLTEMKRVPGLSQVKAEGLGEKITLLVITSEEKRQGEALARMRVEVNNPTGRAVRVRFEEGQSIAAIAEDLSLKPGTVARYLEHLHQVGDLDLRPWIERNMDSTALYKGADYFRNVKNSSFREAYESLGLDYQTLRFCKLYVSGFRQSQQQILLSA